MVVPVVVARIFNAFPESTVYHAFFITEFHDIILSGTYPSLDQSIFYLTLVLNEE